MASKPAVKLPPTKPHYAAIGHVMMQWAFIEREINSEIAWLLKRSKNKGQKVNFQAKFSRRVTAWLTLAKRVYRDPIDIQAINRIAGQAVKIKDERDDIAHGTFVGKGPKLMFQVYREGKLIHIPDTFSTAAEIEDLACRISEIGADLMRHQDALDTRFRKRQ